MNLLDADSSLLDLEKKFKSSEELIIHTYIQLLLYQTVLQISNIPISIEWLYLVS